MSGTRPVIGICTALEQAQWSVWDRRAALLAYDYITAIQRAGAVALMIPPDPHASEDPGGLLERIDGLILAGGADIDPSFYGAERHPMTRSTVPERDRAEISLVRCAIELDMPLLGICRGMQLINVALGGTLIQHVPEVVGHGDHRRNLGTFENAEHDVLLEPASVAARAAGEHVHETKSHHHQAIDQLGEGLVITGHSELDELPETIEAPANRFVLGVQWHPEADEQSLVISTLVEQAREYRGAAV